MANYSKYLSESNSDYIGVYYNTGHVEGYSYGYVGRKDNGAKFWLLFKLPADFPYEGTLLGGYPVDADHVLNANIRLCEVNEGSRGAGTLDLKISPITGDWNGSANWSNIPAYNASVVKTYNSFPYAPGSNHYDYRCNIRYKYYVSYAEGKYAYLMGTYQYFTSYYGETHDVWDDEGGIERDYIGTVYDTYIIYHEIDITEVIKDCIRNHASGLILYYDIAVTNYNRKVFTTTEETANARRPVINISIAEGSGAPPIMIAPEAGAITKNAAAVKVYTGSAWKDVDHMKIYNGSTWKDVY